MNRISSIDILRAITMLLMIFVNDLWSLRDIPGWLEHAPAAADDMGLADTVFPAFLFIVGMSIPLSIQQRIAKGDTTGKLLLHILQRSIALLVMGVFLVNGESINEAATGMPRVAWNMICCSAFILIWNDWPQDLKGWMTAAIRVSAILVLAALALIYRGGEGDDLHERFATHWWGILGLIGWAYLLTAVVFVLGGRNAFVAVVAWLLFMGCCVAAHAGWLPSHGIARKIMAPFGDGSMPAFAMGGTVTTLILLHFRKRGKTSSMLLVFAALAAALIAAGLLVREPLEGISKIRATPAWVLICSGITIGVLIPIYWLVDGRGKGKWFDLIRPAGTNTLLCYLLPYFAYGVVVLIHAYLPAEVLTGAIGLIKSLLFALLIVVITGWLGKAGVRLRL